MSTFCGKIDEIPGISIDRFEIDNLKSEVYFLSHCHVDHMVGLNTPVFQGTLKERNCFIYMSHVSKVILERLFPQLKDNVKELDFYSPTSILLKSGFITVSLIPSGHCPGSVMFLFESQKTILYTGDYRIALNNLKKIKGFYDSHNKLKIINTIYLDTTFFFKDYTFFPTREKSLDAICDLIGKWLMKGHNHLVNINTSARYGYEYVFMEIYKRFKIPIHVGEESYSFYSLIPDMDGAVTMNSAMTRIHSCGQNIRSTCLFSDCESYKELNIKTIKMSAMRWKDRNLREGMVEKNQFGTDFVCYSTHASYSEIIELLEFLKPQRVEPCVLRLNEKIDQEMFNAIDKILEKYKEPVHKKPTLFDIRKISQKEKELKNDGEEEDVEERNNFIDNALNSPPKSDLFEVE